MGERDQVAPDWANLGFRYQPTPWRFQATWRDGVWSPGGLTAEPTITLEEGSTALHYGQQCFEGLKAFAGPDGAVRVFRPDRNAARMAASARRILLPEVPEALFLRAVAACVDANHEHVPPHGSGAALYVRPLLLGTGDNLGLRPAPTALFRVFCSPVGPYFKAGLAPIRLWVTARDRAAPNGTGAFKVGGNYAGGLLATREAKDLGWDEALYLDPREHRFLDEAGSANVFGVLPPARPGGPERLVTPASPTILPSVTMDSVLTLAREELGLEVERRPIPLTEVGDMLELGCTGTAAVITPVAEVGHPGGSFRLPRAPGPVALALHGRLTALQRGEAPDPRGWTVRV